MLKVLLVWEMGGGFGHISRLELVANELLLAGCQVAFAVRDLALTRQWLGQRNFELSALPELERSCVEHVTPLNYSGILASVGYGNFDLLRAKIAAWLDFYGTFSPDFIVADHAPTAILASDFAGIKSLQFGSGFELPPPAFPMPNIRAREVVQVMEPNDVDSVVLRAINKVSALFGGGEYESVGGIFSGRSMLATFPELDHYSRKDLPECVGPIFSETSELSRGWSNTKGRKIFAYVHASTPGYHSIITELRRSNYDVVCVSPGVGRRYSEEFGSDSLYISSRVLDLNELIPDMDAAVVTGGVGIVSRLLLRGIPLLIAPQNIEQQMLGARAVSLGAAATLGGRRGIDSVAGLLRGVLENDSYRKSAIRFALKYAGYSPNLAVSKVVDRVLRDGGCQ